MLQENVLRRLTQKRRGHLRAAVYAGGGFVVLVTLKIMPPMSAIGVRSLTMVPMSMQARAVCVLLYG